MLDLAKLTPADFEPHLNSAFRARPAEGEALDLRLTGIDRLGGDVPKGARGPFALLFQGPIQPELAQGTLCIACEGLGELELFLVPVGRDADGVRYEAVFS